MFIIPPFITLNLIDVFISLLVGLLFLVFLFLYVKHGEEKANREISPIANYFIILGLIISSILIFLFNTLRVYNKSLTELIVFFINEVHYWVIHIYLPFVIFRMFSFGFCFIRTNKKYKSICEVCIWLFCSLVFDYVAIVTCGLSGGVITIEKNDKGFLPFSILFAIFVSVILYFVVLEIPKLAFRNKNNI